MIGNEACLFYLKSTSEQFIKDRSLLVYRITAQKDVQILYLNVPNLSDY